MILRKIWIVTAGLALSLLQCRKPLTTLIVEIDTNVRLSPPPPVAVREIAVTAEFNWDGVTPLAAGMTDRAEINRGAGPAQACLPETFGVRIGESRAGQSLTLLVESAGGQYRRILITTPVAYRTQILRLRVHSLCLSSVTATMATPCPNGMRTCTLALSCDQQGRACGDEGTCVSRMVDGTTLEAIPPAQIEALLRDVHPTMSVNNVCPLSEFGASGADVPSMLTDSSSDAPTSMDVPTPRE